MISKKNITVLILLFSVFIFLSWTLNQDKKGYVISDPAPDKDGKIKILVYHDMEGLSGQDDWRTILFAYPEYYKKGRELLTADVNAVIEGLFNGGAYEVDVVDAHGSGNRKPDLILEKLDSRAKFLEKSLRVRPYVDFTEKDVYDAVAVVGMHSSTGGGGFCAHTYTLGMDWILNDIRINETEIIAFSWGRVGVPLIFASGDDKLKEQLEDMQWIEYATTKYAQNASTVTLKPVQTVHNEMREAAKRAVENLSSAKAVKMKTPIKATLRAVRPARLGIIRSVPGINYEKNSVTFTAQDYQEAYDGITGLIRVAQTGGYLAVLQQTVNKQENAKKINDDFVENLFNTWLKVESKR